MEKNIILRNKILSISVFIISLLFIYIGIIRDEQLTVLKKAINICLECIGIG
ncbi:MAG: CD1871A family CXXC motif-containing protein [Proteocatella sp.]